MEAMAPSLCSELEGVCPECGAVVAASFDPLQYALLRAARPRGFVYEDVCAIAHHCHWSEAEILALPAARRSRYAELAGRAHEREGRSTDAAVRTGATCSASSARATGDGSRDVAAAAVDLRVVATPPESARRSAPTHRRRLADAAPFPADAAPAAAPACSAAPPSRPRSPLRSRPVRRPGTPPPPTWRRRRPAGDGPRRRCRCRNAAKSVSDPPRRARAGPTDAERADRGSRPSAAGSVEPAADPTAARPGRSPGEPLRLTALRRDAPPPPIRWRSPWPPRFDGPRRVSRPGRWPRLPPGPSRPRRAAPVRSTSGALRGSMPRRAGRRSRPSPPRTSSAARPRRPIRRVLQRPSASAVSTSARSRCGSSRRRQRHRPFRRYPRHQRRARHPAGARADVVHRAATELTAMPLGLLDLSVVTDRLIAQLKALYRQTRRSGTTDPDERSPSISPVWRQRTRRRRRGRRMPAERLSLPRGRRRVSPQHLSPGRPRPDEHEPAVRAHPLLPRSPRTPRVRTSRSSRR